METLEREKFNSRLEEQCLHPKLISGTASERADIARNVLVHQFHARASGIVSDKDLAQLQAPYWDKYNKVVDNFDTNEGLNNFAEGALALCNLRRNESQAWKSSLDAQDFLSTPAGERFKTSCKLSAESERQDGEDFIIKVRTVASVQENSPALGGGATPTAQHGVAAASKTSNNFTDGAATPQISSVSSGPNNPFYKQINNTVPLISTSFENGTPAHSKLTHSVSSNVNSFGNRKQNSFNFKKGLNQAERSKLPYELPADWEQPLPEFGPRPKVNPAFHTGNYRNTGNYGDQEVPRKPLFAPSGGTNNVFPGKPYLNHHHQQPGQSFYRKTESAGRYDSDPFKQETEEDETPVGPFKTAREQLSINQQKKYGQNRGPVKPAAYGNVKKSLGTRRGLSSKFVPPVVGREEPGDSNLLLRKAGPNKGPVGEEEPIDERLKGLEPKMIELIMNEIMDHGAPVAWDDIAGLEFAKKTIKEIVVWPMLRPDIFTGLRGPPKGLLLFGPPGTGKTLIGKCIASQSKSTFFSISASSLTSKWVGEGEKMVKALFSVARCHQPAVIFIDEIDSLLSQRTDGEHEASRRIKTEFLVQLDGATTESDERLLVIGATNRPQEIDEAARRRFVKRLYIPLPESLARKQIVVNLLSSQSYQLSEEEIDVICKKTDGYSGSDMANLCREAALGPIRSISFSQIEMITADQVRPIMFEDFDDAVGQVRASVSSKDLELYIEWNKLYGCGGK